MFEGITPQRLLAMTDRESRWFDNVKKAFFESDKHFVDGHPEDRCLQELCVAIDTAKTLRRSLRGEDESRKDNRTRFIEFVHLEVPTPERGGLQITLRDAVTGHDRTYSFADIIYDIRCMIHENENLNVAEGADYHILIDWNARDERTLGALIDGRLVCNGYCLWMRLREILAKFLTCLDGMKAYASGADSFSMGINPTLGSIRPGEIAQTQRRSRDPKSTHDP